MSTTVSPLAPKKYAKLAPIDGVRLETAQAGIKYKNRTDLLAMVFEPNAVALAATRQFVVQSALQQHLGHLIAVQAVSVVAEEATLRVNVRYSLLRDGSQHDARLAVPGVQP